MPATVLRTPLRVSFTFSDASTHVVRLEGLPCPALVEDLAAGRAHPADVRHGTPHDYPSLTTCVVDSSAISGKNADDSDHRCDDPRHAGSPQPMILKMST